MNEEFFSKLTNPFTQLWNSLLDFIYPAHCIVCGKYLSLDEKGVCHACWDGLSILPEPFCPVCKSFLSGLKTRCRACQANENLTMVKSLGTFDDHYQVLIHNFKYKRKTSLGKRLGLRLGENLCSDQRFLDSDLLMPVPLHPARKRERGFNQSEILAEMVSERINVPLAKGILRRIKNTKDQTNLSAEQRRENVAGAFSVSHPERISGKRIILVDDVITTGATLKECAKVLKEAGAKRIVAATLVVAMG